MDNFKTAIVNYICPICGRVAEKNIICNSLLTPKVASEVEKLHNQNVGYSDHACKDCAKYKDDVVYFVGINEEKSTNKDVYRTGQIAGVRKEASLVSEVEKFIITLEDETKFCFIDVNIGKQIGLWND